MPSDVAADGRFWVDGIDYGKDFSQIHPARSYPRRAPNVVNAASRDRGVLHWFYSLIAQSEIAAPAEGYIYLAECYLFDGRYILDSELNWVAPSLADWQVDAAAKAWVIDSIRDSPPPALNCSGSDWHYVLFAQCNADNYGHFLCEAAPKLATMVRAGIRKVRYVLPENCARYEAFTTEMLRYLGIAAEAIAVPAGSFASVKHLLYFTPVSRHDFRKSPTLLEFREAALARFGVKGAVRNKLFIERAVGDRRRIANQDVIASLLAGQGYRSVYPGTMSVAEQIEVFSAASHIVGSVGAGLTNMVFAPAEAEIFYISNGLIDPFFWDISGLCDQRFTWFFARPPQRFDQTVFVSDYTVDPTALAVGLGQAS